MSVAKWKVIISTTIENVTNNNIVTYVGTRAQLITMLNTKLINITETLELDPKIKVSSVSKQRIKGYNIEVNALHTVEQTNSETLYVATPDSRGRLVGMHVVGSVSHVESYELRTVIVATGIPL